MGRELHWKGKFVERMDLKVVLGKIWGLGDVQKVH